MPNPPPKPSKEESEAIGGTLFCLFATIALVCCAIWGDPENRALYAVGVVVALIVGNVCAHRLRKFNKARK